MSVCPLHRLKLPSSLTDAAAAAAAAVAAGSFVKCSLLVDSSTYTFTPPHTALRWTRRRHESPM